MKYLPEESGMLITPELSNLIEKAVQVEGKQSVLSRKIGVYETNISVWRGCSPSKSTESITWDQWGKLRDYFIKAELISEDDPKWMLPSQLRRTLLAMKSLSPDEEKLLRLYRLLEDDAKPVAMLQLQALAGLKNKSESASSGEERTKNEAL